MFIIIEMNINTSSLLSTPRPLAVVVATRARTSSKSQTGQNYYKNKIFVIQFFLVKWYSKYKMFFEQIIFVGIFISYEHDSRFGHQIFFAEEDSNCCTRQVWRFFYMKLSDPTPTPPPFLLCTPPDFSLAFFLLQCCESLRSFDMKLSDRQVSIHINNMAPEKSIFHK